VIKDIWDKNIKSICLY